MYFVDVDPWYESKAFEDFERSLEMKDNLVKEDFMKCFDMMNNHFNTIDIDVHKLKCVAIRLFNIASTKPEYSHYCQLYLRKIACFMRNKTIYT